MTKVRLKLHEPWQAASNGGVPVTFDTAQSVRHKARLSGMNPNYWYPVAFSDEVPPGRVVGAKFWGNPIALFRTKDGELGAVEDRCAHRHVPLTMGHVRGEELVCTYHGWRYGTCGRLTSIWHDDFGKSLPKVEIRSYPLEERYGLIFVFPGHPELASTTPLIDIPHAEGADAWPSLHFHATYTAHHSMVIDNICNLTHVYNHGKWVPYGRSVLTRSKLVGERIEQNWDHTLRRGFGYRFMRLVFGDPNRDYLSNTTQVYDYPYQAAYQNEQIRTVNLMLPMDEANTRVFVLQYWRPFRLPLIPRFVSRAFTKLFVRLVKVVTKEIFRQDGETVMAEQANLAENFFEPTPELNYSVRFFDALNVDRWSAWLRSQESQAAEEGATTSHDKAML